MRQYLLFFLGVGLAIGALALYAALTEKVIVSDQGIEVSYPSLVPDIFRKGWYLPWAEVKALKARTTGQGGLVYYFVNNSGKGYLLPMGVVGFAKLVRMVEEKTGIDTAPPEQLNRTSTPRLLRISTPHPPE